MVVYLAITRNYARTSSVAVSCQLNHAMGVPALFKRNTLLFMTRKSNGQLSNQLFVYHITQEMFLGGRDSLLRITCFTE